MAERGLVLFTEIGRGSTYGGLIITGFIARRIGAFALFATHYFELTALADDISTVANVHLDATEHNGEVVFLHAVRDGPANQSYGIQVAKLAGLPQTVLSAAKRHLLDFETRLVASPRQPDLFSARPSPPNPALMHLRTLEPDTLSPREALAALYELQSLADGAQENDER